MSNYYEVPRKKRQLNNFKFALGMGLNWCDIDRGLMYMIQEYKEKMDNPEIPTSQKPKKIRIVKMSDGTEVEALEPEIIEERMKDPDIDPRYAPETPEEFRRSFK